MSDTSHGDGGEDSLIVSVYDGFGTVPLLHDRTWYWLEESSDSDLVDIVLCGHVAWIPAGAMVQHETGLTALLLAHDVGQLMAEFAWRMQ